MKTKKLIAILLILAACLLAGCQEGSSGPPAENNGEQTDNPAVNPGSEDGASGVIEPGEEQEDNGVGEIFPAVIHLEGNPETVNYAYVAGSFGYTLPMDVDRFRFAPGDEADYVYCLDNESVWLSVAYYEDTSAEEALAALEIPDDASTTAGSLELADNEYHAETLHVVYGDQPESAVRDYYFLDYGNGCYVIAQSYFLAAAEGWGARMYYLAQGFAIQ